MNSLLNIFEQPTVATAAVAVGSLEGQEKKKIRRGKKYCISNSTIVILRLLLVFLLPLIDFLSDVVLIGTIMGPALETTEVCIEGTNKTFKGGKWSVNGELCGLVDQHASDLDQAGCTADQIKPPRDGKCYSRQKHNMVFFEDDANTTCQTNRTKCDVPQRVKYFSFTNSFGSGGLEDIYSYPEFTVCSARGDLNSSFCPNGCAVDTDVSATTDCSASCKSCPDRASCYERNAPRSFSTRTGFESAGGSTEMGGTIGTVQVGGKCFGIGEGCNNNTDCCQGNCISGSCQTDFCAGNSPIPSPSPSNNHLCQWIGTDDEGMCAPVKSLQSCDEVELPLNDTCNQGMLLASENCYRSCGNDSTAGGTCKPLSWGSTVSKCGTSYGLVKCKSAYVLSLSLSLLSTLTHSLTHSLSLSHTHTGIHNSTT
jgi:hypothetical protein